MATPARTAHWCAAVLIFNKVEKISMMMRGSVSDAARLAAESGGPARWTCWPVGPWACRITARRSLHATTVAMRAMQNTEYFLFLGEDRPSGAPLGPGDDGKVIGVA